MQQPLSLLTACLLQSAGLLGAGTPEIGQSVTRRLGVQREGGAEPGLMGGWVVRPHPLCLGWILLPGFCFLDLSRTFLSSPAFRDGITRLTQVTQSVSSTRAEPGPDSQPRVLESCPLGFLPAALAQGSPGKPHPGPVLHDHQPPSPTNGPTLVPSSELLPTPKPLSSPIPEPQTLCSICFQTLG